MCIEFCIEFDSVCIEFWNEFVSVCMEFWNEFVSVCVELGSEFVNVCIEICVIYDCIDYFDCDVSVIYCYIFGIDCG